MARLVHVYETATSGSGTFVRCKERFVISDDWAIKPASTSMMKSLPYKLSSDAIFHGFEEVEVCVGCAEVVSMLTVSLSSDTIFTDVFLPKATEDPAARVTVKSSAAQKILRQPDKDSSPEITIKLFYDKKDKKAMYAECKREFVDVLLGFLTYPLGSVIKDKGAHADAAPSRKSPKRQCTAPAVCHLGGSFDNL
uniref:Uncharacterized protein n=1 Tax=Triticum urartu TaxID=4572 RepID=A0A8R7ULE2_TRIUA